MTHSPFRVGLTGGIGSGKSTVSAIFEKLDIPVIDADRISRELVAPGQAALAEIVDVFGTGILTSEGELDRSSLRQQIFSEKAQRRKLEAILHPRIRAEMERRAQFCARPYAILVIPLLVETGQIDLVDFVVSVEAPENLRKNRILKRDKTTESEVNAIFSAQADENDRRARADAIIMNTGALEDLEQRVRHMHVNLLAQAERSNGN